MLKTFWSRLTGRLASSRALLIERANGEAAAVHATAIAMHGIVESLERMRGAMRVDGAWHTTPQQAAREALVAPSKLLRQCVRPTHDGLRPGALVLFRLRGMHANTESNDLALSRNAWSECPAHAIVPRLLQEVWRTAVLHAASRRYRPRRSRLYRFLAGAVARAFAVLNRRWPWYRLPRPLGFLNLAVLRAVLREKNLYDTSLLPSIAGAVPPAGPDVLRWRTADGSFNDLRDPNMGRVGTRFGRNVPLGYTYSPDNGALLDPNPRLVSRDLLSRRGRDFTPAGTQNVLSAAWIQFQVHDWFHHGNASEDDPITVPVADSDDWIGDRPIRIGRTPADPTRANAPAAGPPTYINHVTHWWDASQLYGSDLATQWRVREARHGKLHVDDRARLRVDRTGIEVTGFTANWWLGLSVFHHLFTYEHNAICDRLRAEYPDWDDERLFQTARLINAALIAKIHEVEWVPTILRHPTVQKGLKVNWWGLLGEWVARNIGRFHASDMLGGVPGSATHHHAAPFAITEEFVSVYRMHAFMMPDWFRMYSLADGQPADGFDLIDVLGPGSARVMDKIGMANVIYSFGRTLPGALTLGNYATALQQLRVPDMSNPGKMRVIDLATIDIVRDRERGVPRYNQFRELLHLPPVRSFKELNEKWAEELERVYGTVDRIDTMVGLFAETPPPDFGFSDTTFRIFLLMNPRRLKSDRFFTVDYRPEIYTQLGLDWIDGNNLSSVMLRHLPELAPALAKVDKIFGPWRA
jgi:hypothetical protein